MKTKDYEAACLKFAAETRERDSLDDNNHYQTIGGEWEETTDGSTAGISVKWAFHKTPDEIKAVSAQRFVDELLGEIDQSPGIYGDNETAVRFMNWLAEIMR